MKRSPYFLYTLMAFGYAFLYLPIVSVVAYSFNKSRLVTVWGGFSTQWYGKLFDNQHCLLLLLRRERLQRLSDVFRFDV